MTVSLDNIGAFDMEIGIPGVPENMIHFEKIIAFDSIEINS